MLFSSSTEIDDEVHYRKFLKDYNIRKVTRTDECTILCVGHDRTPSRHWSMLLLSSGVHIYGTGLL